MKTLCTTFNFLILSLLSTAAFSQVQGTVTDLENDSPLPGVSILIKGTSTGTITDLNGQFRLSQISSSDTLVFSSVGYETLEVPINNRSQIDISLSPDIQSLSEIVGVGDGTQKREDVTGAVVSAPLEAIEEAPNTNILQSLSGSTPGIDIGQAASAGEEPTIQVRGQASINGNQNPLIILDGVYYRGRLADLNPNDIASVDVLKDPSSMAVYGAQAANGVVIVTTKSGKSAQAPVISYSGFYTTQSPANELTPLGREGYLKGVRDVEWENGYLAPDFIQENPDWAIENDTGLFPPLLEGFANGTDYSWYDEVTDPGYITDHQLSIRGSGEHTSYFLSGGYTDQKGWMLNDTYRRITARVNVDTEITDWLTVGANTFGAFSDFSGESPILSQIPQMSPLVTPYDENGELVVNPLGDNRLNPFLQSAADDRDLRNNLSGIFYAQVRVPQIPGLSYRVNFSNNYRWEELGNANPFDNGQAGRAIKINRATYDLVVDNIITYNRELGENHEIDVTLLYGFNRISFNETRAEGSNFTNLALSYNSLEQAVIQQIFSDAWEERYLYQMGRINYGFREKYLLTATLRRDGFSGFSERNKVGIFPSLGLGWVLSEENFLANVEAINFLKLRASYGINGNLTDRYSSLARISSGGGNQYLFGDGGSTVNGQRVASLANPNLSWERTVGINVGVDFTLLDRRLSGSVDYYQSSTTDLLWDFVLPEITGFQQIRSNVGEISNTGLEMLVNASAVRGTNFSWDIQANFATNTNRIESLLGLDRDGDGQEDDLIANGLFIGEPVGAVYGYVIDGIWQVGDENIPDGFAPGLYRLRDLNDDGQITPQDDRQILGYREPSYQFGIQNTLRYKNFAFKFFIKSIQGGSDGYLSLNNPWDGGYSTPGNAQSSNWFAEVDYWTPSNPGATYRRPGPDAAISQQRFFARSFVRLQDISLSYTLGQGLLDRIGLQEAKLFVSGKNLLTFTDWEGWDPETGQGLGPNQRRQDDRHNNDNRDNNRNRSALPVMRGITVGLNISL